MTQRFLVLIGSGLFAGAAWGQSVPIPSGATKVEQGIGDRGALGGMSRIDMRRDLRQERGFGDVFRMNVNQPYGGPGGASPMFFRIDGGIAAVFPEGVYRETRNGEVPEIPPGTRFYVGGLPASMFESRPVVRSPYFVDMSVSMRGDRPPEAPTLIPPGAAPVLGGGGIWDGESQRQRTVGALLDRAARGG